MIFSKRGTFYRVSRVTGPRHNFLAIELAIGSQEAGPEIEMVAGFCSGHDSLDPAAIVRAVLEGLDLANGTFDTQYEVLRLQYRAGDNPPEEIYGVLAFKVVEHLISGGEFVQGQQEVVSLPDRAATGNLA